MSSDTLDSILLDAKAARDAGDRAGAERWYRDVLATQPANADAYCIPFQSRHRINHALGPRDNVMQTIDKPHCP